MSLVHTPESRARFSGSPGHSLTNTFSTVFVRRSTFTMPFTSGCYMRTGFAPRVDRNASKPVYLVSYRVYRELDTPSLREADPISTHFYLFRYATKVLGSMVRLIV